MELIPPLGVGKVIDSTPASVHKDPNSECLRPIIPGLEKLRNGVSMQEISCNTLKICVKARFPILKLPFSLVLCSLCYDFDRDFEGVARYFSEFLW